MFFLTLSFPHVLKFLKKLGQARLILLRHLLTREIRGQQSRLFIMKNCPFAFSVEL